MDEDEMLTACLLVVGYPEVRVFVIRDRNSVIETYDWSNHHWLGEVREFYRSCRDVATDRQCEPHMSQFVGTYISWLKEKAYGFTG